MKLLDKCREARFHATFARVDMVTGAVINGRQRAVAASKET